MNLKDLKLNSEAETQAMAKAALIERIVTGEILSFSKEDEVEFGRHHNPFGELKPRFLGETTLTIRVRYPKPPLEEASDDDLLSEIEKRFKK